MKASIFIIDNESSLFDNYKDILESNFNCEVFPKDNNVFLKHYISQYIDKCHDCKNAEKVMIVSDEYLKIQEYIAGLNVTHIMVDINLTTEKDGYGDNLFEFLTKHFASAIVKKFTWDKPGHEYIMKKTDNERMKSEFKKKLLLEESSDTQTENTAENTAENKQNNVPDPYFSLKLKIEEQENEIKRYKVSKGINTITTILGYNIVTITIAIYALYEQIPFDIAIKWLSLILMFFVTIFLFIRWIKPEKISNDITSIRDNINDWITMFFYIFILLSLPITVGIAIYHFQSIESPNALIISENLFLIFLPFFIICGFYFFYKKSLFTVVTGKDLDEKFDEGIKLMNIIKTFFVSSIISFLVVKVIEIIYVKEDDLKHAFQNIETKANLSPDSLKDFKNVLEHSFNEYTIFQLVLYSFLIILLMVFYVKIKHHPDSK